MRCEESGGGESTHCFVGGTSGDHLAEERPVAEGRKWWHMTIAVVNDLDQPCDRKLYLMDGGGHVSHVIRGHVVDSVFRLCGARPMNAAEADQQVLRETHQREE